MSQIPLWGEPPSSADRGTEAPSVEEFLDLLMRPSPKIPDIQIPAEEVLRDTRTVRQWALEHGIDLATNDPIPDYVLTAYKRACVDPSPF